MSFDLSTAQTVEGPVVVQTPREMPQPSEGKSEAQQTIEKVGFGAMGAGVGSAAAYPVVREGRIRGKEEAEARLERARVAARIEEEAAQAAKSAPPPTPKPSSGAAAWTMKMGGEELMPRAIAAQAESMRKTDARGGQRLIDQQSAALERVRQMGEGGQRLADLPGGTQLSLPREVAEDIAAKQAAATADEARRAAEAAQQAAQQAAKRSGLESVTEMYRSMMNRINAPLRVLGPIAGGISGGLDIANLRSQLALPKEERDIGQMIESGTSLVGGAMSLVPGGQIPGLGISLAAPMFARNIREHQSRMATDPEYAARMRSYARPDLSGLEQRLGP
jgi:hypothetical protein